MRKSQRRKKMDAVFLYLVLCHKLPGHWSMGVWHSQWTFFPHSSCLASAAKLEWKCLKHILLSGGSATWSVAWIQTHLYEEWIEPAGLHYAPICFSIQAVVRFVVMYTAAEKCKKIDLQASFCSQSDCLRFHKRQMQE